jgi:hypothetical protein
MLPETSVVELDPVPKNICLRGSGFVTNIGSGSKILVKISPYSSTS